MSADASPDKPADPAKALRIRLRTREVLTLIGLAAIAGAAVGYLVADHTTMSIAARVLASDTIVLLPGTWVAITLTRRLVRIETTLSNQLDAWMAGYNSGYVDCLKHQHRH